MIEILKYIYEYIGGAPTLLVFLGFFIAYIYYYRGFYRLVYSSSSIIKDYETKISRVLFYNNGLKTLTNENIKYITIKCSETIYSSKIVKNKSEVDIKISRKSKKENFLNIQVDDFDKSNYFIVEINHTGSIEIEGRVSETGKILRDEFTSWKVVNILLVVCLTVLFVISVNTRVDGNEIKDYVGLALDFVILIVLVFIVSLIHRVFFIPNNISNQIETKDKSKMEFKKKF